VWQFEFGPDKRSLDCLKTTHGLSPGYRSALSGMKHTDIHCNISIAKVYIHSSDVKWIIFIWKQAEVLFIHPTR